MHYFLVHFMNQINSPFYQIWYKIYKWYKNINWYKILEKIEFTLSNKTMEETMSKLLFNMKKIINNIRNNQKNIQNINKAIK